MSTKDKAFVNKRRQLPMYCVLIDHPHEGVILWETGCGKDYPEVWGPQVSDVFSRVKYEPHHELDAQIEATGHKVEDVKKIIIGHLHLDVSSCRRHTSGRHSLPCLHDHLLTLV